MLRAINTLPTAGETSKPLEPEKPTVTPSPTPQPTAPPLSLGPGIVQHLQISQKRTVSTDPSAPYALQVILQTSVTGPSPTAFMLETNGDIESGGIFVSGQSVMMQVATGVQPDRRHFFFSFAFPSFTPENPIVVTLLSKTDIQVVGIANAR